MLGRISLWAAGAVLAGLMLPSQAMAQYDAHVATDLNLRVGPGTEYGVIDVIPGGYPVDVLGCLDAYEWCDIEWDGLRGWVSARYLVQPDTNVYLPDYGPRIGVPIISFSFGAYHDRYYRDRPWYRERRGGWDYGDWRDRDWDRDDDRDRDRDRDQAEDRDRDRDRERAGQREQRREAERPQRQEREAERPQRQEREARPQRQEREARPQRQQREARPQRQEREARPQRQQREARPQQAERTQRQGQRSQRSNSGGPQERQRERGR